MAAKVAPPRSAANGFPHSNDLNWATETQKIPAQERKAAFPAFNGFVDGSHSCRTLAVPSKKKVKNESLLGMLCTQICKHQIGISVNLLLLIFLAHICFPRARRRTSKFFHLSYYNPKTGLYGCGNDDVPLVLLWIVIFTGLRAVIMDYVLDPLARLGGIRTRKELVRFKEQAWLIVYCSVFWSLGMYIMYHSEFWLNLSGMWHGWPFREVSGLHKWYYLVQFAFWIQQILVVNIEEKRKDYAQMFTHHIFTCVLLFASYGYLHMRVGTVILCIMDVIDIILPTAKILKYMGYTTACDIAFGVFMAVWVVTRHIFFPFVCWSIYAHTPSAMAPGCYLPDGSVVLASSAEQYDALGGNNIFSNILQAYLNREGPICWNPTIRWSFLYLLLALQVILLFWFAMVIKVAYKVITGQGADDDRSDDEDEDLDIGVEDEHRPDLKTSHPLHTVKSAPEWLPVEQEVGVESLTFVRKASPGVRYKRSSGSRTSGISIPGHGDRKELLGRIGCDKPT
ncbi:longevity assurance proteins LAG1/LAC1 [Lindgomyces ingoldianus]|uniref:Longevity assurance proteins LAG1/LAC1 n=1 Tax=Lindgomyces ingoldianus TaxID=673940 RepID=A0ACB6QRG8_9PLEO|nr:longevity assurance proteins LAG1/LAC1 [Lindgomyces ingoldianus]KAF2469485.1 longevity assurance proteins LAG1/LAC1 [Lindgomyces ingoldianus]